MSQAFDPAAVVPIAQQGQSDLTDASAGEKFKEVAIYFLAGTAMIIGLVLLVFVISKFYDKFCTCWGAEYALTQEEIQERQNASNVTKQAGLAGMLPEEKNTTLRHFFTKHANKYVVSDEVKQRRIEAQAAKDAAAADAAADDTENKNETNNYVDGDDVESGSTTTKEETSDPSQDVELEELCMMEHEEGTCPICLQEYADGDLIITGSTCDHQFHLECAMQWMEKGNDHCAYCRKDMIKSDELLTSAREVLGTERVEKLVKINELAAQRIETIETSMVLDANNTDISRQLATSGSLTVPTANDGSEATSATPPTTTSSQV